MYRETVQVHPMQHFSAIHFVFLCEALEHIQLDAQPGTALRGALYHALIDLFSPNEPIPGVPLDPVRALLADEDESNPRGRDMPRAFTVEPPPPYTHIGSGRRFRFGVTLFGSAGALVPYLFRAVPKMGKLGIGKGRGTFRLTQIYEESPLNDTRRVIMHHQHVVDRPRLMITHPRVLEELGMRRTDEVTLRFLTPMRLIESGSLVHTPKLGPLLRRLIERAQALVEHYQSADSQGDAQPVSRMIWKDEWQRIGDLGDQIDSIGTLLDATRWVDIKSYSRARERSTPIGGFIGQVRWRINSPDVLTWLLWGQSLHVGKNAAKGDGYFHIE